MDEIINWLKNSFAPKKKIEEKKPLEIEVIEDEDIIIPEVKAPLSLKESYDLFMEKKDFFEATQRAESMLELGIEGAGELLEDALRADIEQLKADIEQLKKEGNTFLIGRKTFYIKQREEKLLENSLRDDYKRYMENGKFSDASQKAELMYKHKFKDAEKLLKESLIANIEQLRIAGNDFDAEQRKKELKELHGSIMRKNL